LSGTVLLVPYRSSDYRIAWLPLGKQTSSVTFGFSDLHFLRARMHAQPLEQPQGQGQTGSF
jgi:hypothetical protein